MFPHPFHSSFFLPSSPPHLRTFILAVLSAWNSFPQIIFMVHSYIPFSSLFKCPLSEKLFLTNFYKKATSAIMLSSCPILLCSKVLILHVKYYIFIFYRLGQTSWMWCYAFYPGIFQPSVFLGEGLCNCYLLLLLSVCLFWSSQVVSYRTCSELLPSALFWFHKASFSLFSVDFYISLGIWSFLLIPNTEFSTLPSPNLDLCEKTIRLWHKKSIQSDSEVYFELELYYMIRYIQQVIGRLMD